jgi:hypothetical protein
MRNETVMTKTRDEILKKVNSLAGSANDDPVTDDVQEILTTIAGEDESSMLSDADTADLLHSRDIYHFQSAAVRIVRRFLAN